MLHGVMLAAVDVATPASEAMLHGADLAVLVGYLALIVLLGLWLGGRGANSDEFMAAGRSMPGWAIGLAMFGSYVSSISFLGNSGKAFAANWSFFAFSLSAPIAAPIAIRWFMPFYRHHGEISAYEHLESRFGAWARTYAVVCYLLTQTARMGTIVYLLGVAVAPLTGWDIGTTIVVTGAIMTGYTFTGGIKSAVWVGAIQSVVLVAGVVVCVASVVHQTPGGVRSILEIGSANGKFGFDRFTETSTEPILFVVVIYGFVTHLANLGVDQSYVQRYLTARSDREAAKSIWLTALLYLPAAGIFFFLGTGLFAFYTQFPDLLPAGLKSDQVLPHFVSTQLPAGLAGLVVASLFAASMDSNLSSMATLTLCDVYKRYFRPDAGERKSINVLRASMIAWGAAGTGIGLAMINAHGALAAWWDLAGLFAGGVLGLFLLGLISRHADNVAGALAVAIGTCVSIWMMLPKLVDVPPSLRSPFHSYMTLVIATLTIFAVGLAVSSWRARVDDH